MRVDVYESSTQPMLFLFVPRGADPTRAAVPAGFDFGTWALFKVDFDMGSWSPRGGVEATEVVRQIEAVGFALTYITTRLTLWGDSDVCGRYVAPSTA